MGYTNNFTNNSMTTLHCFQMMITWKLCTFYITHFTKTLNGNYVLLRKKEYFISSVELCTRLACLLLFCFFVYDTPPTKIPEKRRVEGSTSTELIHTLKLLENF